MSPRSPDSCSLRMEPRRTDATEVAKCSLLAALTQVHDLALIEVERAACEACCESFEPTTEDINPTIASLLYQITDDIQQRGGVAGCTANQARQLRCFAEKCLPPVPCDDSDGFDTLSQYHQQPRSLSLRRIHELVPRPATQGQPSVRNWAVAVTTAPRRQPTLDVCLDSLSEAGWTEPVLFQDGEIPVSKRAADLGNCTRHPKVGPFPNFFLALV